MSQIVCDFYLFDALIWAAHPCIGGVSSHGGVTHEAVPGLDTITHPALGQGDVGEQGAEDDGQAQYDDCRWVVVIILTELVQLLLYLVYLEAG